MPSPDPISLGWGGTIGRLTEGLEWAGTPQQFKEEVVSGSFSSWRVRIGERKVRKDCALFSLNNNERGEEKLPTHLLNSWYVPGVGSHRPYLIRFTKFC